MTWEVQTYTACDGWVNTWTVDEGSGDTPETFPTREAAEAALAEFLEEMAEQLACGQIEDFDPDDYCVAVTCYIERHELVWQGIRIRVSYEPDWLGDGDGLGDMDYAHLQLETIEPERVPLPVTETGYRSHFTHASAIASMGGPVAFVEAWLDAEACKPAWREHARQSRQLALF